MIRISQNAGFRPSGVYAAIVTPLDENGDIDHDALETYIEHLEDGGVDGLVAVGCTGHAPSLSDEERIEFVQAIEAMTDLDVIAGIGKPATWKTVELAERFEERTDVDAYLVISPATNKPEPHGMVNHYRTVAEAVDTPVIAYNVPSRTGRNMTAQTVVPMEDEQLDEGIADIPGVVGIKEASGDREQIAEIGRRLDERGLDEFYLGSGNDGQNVYIYEQGGRFAISVTANVHPQALVQEHREAMDDNREVARNHNERLQPLTDAMFVETNPRPVHYALERLGIEVGRPRRPLREELLSDSREQVDRALDRLDLVSGNVG